MILLLIPLAGVMLGLGLWAALRGFGALNLPGAEPSSGRGRSEPWIAREPRERSWRPSTGGYAGTGIRERIENLPQGCLFAVIITAGVWVLGWLIVLVVGLSYLS